MELQRTDDWFKARLGRFTASKIHLVAAVGKAKLDAEEKAEKEEQKQREAEEKAKLAGKEYTRKEIEAKEPSITQGMLTYIVDCVVEDITQTWSEVDVKAMRWGRMNEPRAIAIFELLYNKDVVEMPFVPYGEHSGGSPDGAILEENAVIEVKCPHNSSYHVKHLTMKEPADLLSVQKEYYAQLQWNMHVTGSDKGYFISYDPRILDNPLLVLEIPLDEEYINYILEGLEVVIPVKEELYDMVLAEVE